MKLGSSFESTHLKAVVETLMEGLKKDHPHAHDIFVDVRTKYGLLDVKATIDTGLGKIPVLFSPVFPGGEELEGQVCLSYGEGNLE
jgi:hypothetical protein